MHLLHMGFEKLSDVLLDEAIIWDAAAFSGMSIADTSPRVTGGSHLISTTGSDTFGRKLLGGNYSHLFAGIGYMIRSASISATPVNCTFTFYDGATPQVGWKVLSDGSIGVYRGASTAATLLGQTAAGVITAAGTGGDADDYKMIQVEVVFHASAGTVTINVADPSNLNGTNVLSLTGQNTAPSGNPYATNFRLLMCPATNMIECVDDLYINDDSGPAPENGFFGDPFAVFGAQPNANGTYSEWLGSDGNSVNNYLLINDPGSSDGDYIASGTPGQRDTHNYPSLVTTVGTVVGVSHTLAAKKDDAATRAIASMLRTNSTDHVGPDKSMTSSTLPYVTQWLINPDTGLRFTIDEINAAEWGVRVQS